MHMAMQLAANIFVTMYFQLVQHDRVHWSANCILCIAHCILLYVTYCFSVHGSNDIAVHRQELPTPLTQCRLNTTNYCLIHQNHPLKVGLELSKKENMPESVESTKAKDTPCWMPPTSLIRNVQLTKNLNQGVCQPCNATQNLLKYNATQ